MLMTGSGRSDRRGQTEGSRCCSRRAATAATPNVPHVVKAPKCNEGRVGPWCLTCGCCEDIFTRLRVGLGGDGRVVSPKETAVARTRDRRRPMTRNGRGCVVVRGPRDTKGFQVLVPDGCIRATTSGDTLTHTHVHTPPSPCDRGGARVAYPSRLGLLCFFRVREPYSRLGELPGTEESEFHLELEERRIFMQTAIK